jgi:hypothetical protein
MTADRDGSACTGAVVRKLPVKERAGDEVPIVMPGYGDYPLADKLAYLSR